VEQSGPNDDFERMTDEIVAASSEAELAWWRVEVARSFASHPRRRELDHLIDNMVRVITPKRFEPPARSPDSGA
jgi:hypothetical protein